ncbi:MAG: hypothetical protein H6536_00860 [Bacteroidales bacterium]|nr:hypothetical protein [Bacteroidales bacterium]
MRYIDLTESASSARLFMVGGLSIPREDWQTTVPNPENFQSMGNGHDGVSKELLAYGLGRNASSIPGRCGIVGLQVANGNKVK